MAEVTVSAPALLMPLMVMQVCSASSITMRGIKKPGSKTVTTVTRGEFKENMELQKQFLAMVKD